ncbi:MAG: D-alanine--D-alanine ligase family protein [Planctomycetota bacterium]
MSQQLNILVLGGGPDRERPVSLKSAAAVADALREAGHTVTESDITPEDLSALDTPCDVVFPVLHGPWGEGGGLQRILEERGLKFVGSGSEASARAMDKHDSKQTAEAAGVNTPAYQLLREDSEITLPTPLVIKPIADGSSFGVNICHTDDEAIDAHREWGPRYEHLLAEAFTPGREMTVGILDGAPLPVLEITPGVDFYDYDAKYDRDDTEYRFDPEIPATTAEQMTEGALSIYRALGCRHLARVDFIVDDDQKPWFLEINTIPGFTDHSLLPKAAAKAGYSFPDLCDRLARLAQNS